MGEGSSLEEGLNGEIVREVVEYLSQAEALIVGGTSLSVYPAAGFIRYFHGKHLILINKTETPYDKDADMVLHCGLGELFSKVNVDKY